jgi:hypothetical protein
VPSATHGAALRELLCRHCGSKRVRRSRAHATLERFLRTVTPIRFHVCGDCRRRGWHWPSETRRETPTSAPARPVEQRDVRRKSLIRKRTGTRVLVAFILGTLFALAIRSCQDRPTTAHTGSVVSRRSGLHPAPVG